MASVEDVEREHRAVAEVWLRCGYLVSLAAIFSVGSPAMPYGRERLMEQWIQYPEVGNAVIDAGHPARLKVAVSGKPEPFMIQVIAHADRGLNRDRLRCRSRFA